MRLREYYQHFTDIFLFIISLLLISSHLRCALFFTAVAYEIRNEIYLKNNEAWKFVTENSVLFQI
jgi:hypothetical protein